VEWIGLIASMTGYARAQGADERRRWVWEARSVNGRNLEVRCRVPQGFERLENPARAAAGARLKRGNVALSLTINSERQSKPLRINRALLAELGILVEEVRKSTGAAAPAADGLRACAASSRRKKRARRARRPWPPSTRP
jgi:uncharacterized protein (TIGR00255 family)